MIIFVTEYAHVRFQNPRLFVPFSATKKNNNCDVTIPRSMIIYNIIIIHSDKWSWERLIMYNTRKLFGQYMPKTLYQSLKQLKLKRLFKKKLKC